jgi:hypothetical protein
MPTAVRHLTTDELAERLGYAPETIRDWRKHGRGPAYLKEGRADSAGVRYRLIDVEAWEESLIVRPGG